MGAVSASSGNGAEDVLTAVPQADPTGGAGLVVYRELSSGDNRRKPQIGDDAFPGQPLIAVPDTSQLLVETHIREIDLHKMDGSPRVRVRVVCLRPPAISDAPSHGSYTNELFGPWAAEAGVSVEQMLVQWGENLTLLGSANLQGFGNTLVNTITAALLLLYAEA